MDTKNNGVDEAVAADTPLPKVKEVEEWLLRDVRQCINFLNVINTDPDLRRSMATWMLGRMQNKRNQEALKNQSHLFPDA